MLVAEGKVEPEVNYSHHALTRMIQKHYNIELSRTPILQALTVVDREGLFEQKATVGAALKVHSDDEKQSLHELRERIETYIVSHLAEHVDNRSVRKKDLESLEKVLKRARKALREDDKRAFIKSGRKFHCGLSDLAGLTSLTHTVEAMWAQSTAFYAEAMIANATQTVMRKSDMEAILDEHSAILDAIHEGDVKGAERAAKTHFHNALQRSSV